MKIKIDSRNGGNGDIWMRLLGFYAVSKLANIKFEILIPKNLLSITKNLFGDRILIAVNSGSKTDYTYTSLGLRNVYKQLFKGNKFAMPYATMVYEQKKHKSIKDFINFFLLARLNAIGLIQLSPVKILKYYQGYIEITALKRFRTTQYPQFAAQLLADKTFIEEYLKTKTLASECLQIPGELTNSILVFPTGTGRQFFPAWWAVQYLPDAYYAFYYKDSEKEVFKTAGLKTIEYYSPEDIIVLSQIPKWCISSDSFPSHLLQYVSENCTIAITGTPAYRVISPVYKGKIVDAVAACHPCRHLDRKNHPYCEAGFRECINWKSEDYTNNILSTIPDTVS